MLGKHLVLMIKPNRIIIKYSLQIFHSLILIENSRLLITNNKVSFRKIIKHNMPLFNLG